MRTRPDFSLPEAELPRERALAGLNRQIAEAQGEAVALARLIEINAARIAVLLARAAAVPARPSLFTVER